MTYAITPLMGVNKTEPSADSPNFALGAKVIVNDGGEIIYVKAAATISAGDVLQIDSNGNATPLTTSLAANDTTTAPLYIGVADVNITSGQYAWATLRGIPTAGINVAASCVKGAPLYTTATAGRVDDSSSSTHLISGMMLTATCGGAAAVTAGYCSNPVLTRGTVNA